LVQGCSDRIKIYSVNHHIRDKSTNKAEVRLDADIDLVTADIKFAHSNEDIEREDWFQAYTPAEEDGCYIEQPDGAIADAQSLDSKVCWWHVSETMFGNDLFIC
jgi:hypothetical protein